MKISLLTLLLVFLWSNVNSQFHYTIVSQPDSVLVKMNDKDECVTPCRIKYYWKIAQNDKIIFSMNQEGYEMWSDTLKQKPSTFNKTVNIVLTPIKSEVKVDSNSAIIAFDKVIANFKDGEQIGTIINKEGEKEPIKWEGTVRIGAKPYENMFYETVDKIGYNLPQKSVDAKLFSDSKERTILPRYIIGAQITKIEATVLQDNINSYGSGNYIATTRISVEWQVLDKSTDKIVLKHKNEGYLRERTKRPENFSNQTLLAFEKSLINFASTPEMIALVNENKSTFEIFPKTESNQDNIAITLSKTPSFENMSLMIKYVSKSCATVITDAGHGSGVFIDSRGYFLTAYHVINGVNKIKVKIFEGIELDATLVSFDEKHDIALLKVNGANFQSLPISLRATELGDEAITIGTPADVELGQSLSKGMISGMRTIEDQNVIQIDMAVSPGNSGGPLINDKGEIVGIVLKKLIGKGIEGIGFAIPITKVILILNLQIN